MKNILSLVAAGLIALVMGLTSIVSAQASPISVQRAPIASNVELVKYKHNRGRHWGHRHHYRHGWRATTGIIGTTVPAIGSTIVITGTIIAISAS
jgi:hypothetical protein